LRKWDREKFRRVHVLTHADLGDSLAAQARYDEAVGAWTRSLDLTSGVDSGRAQTAMRSVVPALLTYRRRGVPGAVDLYERLARYDIDRTMTT